MVRLRFPGLQLAAEVALSAALDAILRRLDALEKKPTAPPVVVADFAAREGQYVRVQAPPSGLRIVLPKPMPANRGAEITFSLETTGPVTFVCVDGLVNREAFVTSSLLGTFKAVCNGETGWSVGFGVTSSGNTPGPAGPPGVQGLQGEPGEPGEQGPPGDTANPLRPIPDQRVLGNDSGAIAYPAPITVHQELDWLGSGSQSWIFDGVDDEIQMGDVLNMTRTTARSMFVWYATTASGAVGVGKQSGASTAGWRFAVPSSSSTQDVILSNAGGGQQIQVGASPRPPTDGTEHHFGWTYNGNSNASGFTLYLDGAATGKSTGTNNLTSGVITNTEPLQIGQRGTSAPFAGTLRHVSIWNRELTAGEAAQVYGGGSPPDLSALSFFSDCIGWWKIDDSDTTAAGGIADYSASNNDGTALNGLSKQLAVGALAVRGAALWQLIPPGATGAYLTSTGTASVPAWQLPDNVTSSVTGTQNALAFPAGFQNRDTLDLTLTGATTLNGIDATGIPAGFEFVLRVGTSGGFTLTINDESGSATTTNRLNTPDNLAVLIAEDCGIYIRRALTRWLIVDRGWPNASTSIVYSGRALQRAALTGAVTATQNSNATAFGTAAAKSVLTNNTNATAVPAFLAGTAARQVFRINAANTGTEWGALTSDSLPSGPRGEDGAEGPPGDMGPPGPTGATGATGLQGPPGIDGVDGVDGVDGARGEVGATGATGAQGPPGAQGEPGEPGEMGRPGPGISDGDKGHVVVSASAATWRLAPTVAVTGQQTISTTTDMVFAVGEDYHCGAVNDVCINAGSTAGGVAIHAGLTPKTGANNDRVTITADDQIVLEPTGSCRIFTGGVERLEIENDGAWQLAGNTGTAGQVIVSAGSAAPPAWGSVSLSALATQTETTVVGRARAAGTGVPIALSANQLLEVRQTESKRLYRWEFEGDLSTLANRGWTIWDAPTITQRDVGAGHSANHPGQIQLQGDAALADEYAIYIGPWDFSSVDRFGATVLIPSDGGGELSNCALGFGLVTDPTDMDLATSGGLWTDNNVVVFVRAGGAGAGNWTIRREDAGSGAAANVTTVAVDTWYQLEARQTASGTWQMAVTVAGVTSTISVSGAPASGIAYLAIGGIRAAGAAGRNIVVDEVWLETSALSRSSA